MSGELPVQTATSSSKAPIIGIGLIFIFFIALFYGIAAFDSVEPSHKGVIVQFSKIKSVMNPGWKHTGIFAEVHPYDMRTRKVQIELTGANSAVDKDGQAVYATINVNYRVKPDEGTILSLYKNVGKNDVIEDRLNIDAIIREGFKQATVQFKALEILENRQQVKEMAKQNIHNNFPYEYFEIQNIVVANIDFSEQFNKAIDDKKTAEQTALAEQNKVAIAKAKAAQEIERFKGEAEKMRLQKQEVTALLNEQKMIDKWDGKLPAYLIITPDSQGMFLQLAQGQGAAQK